MAKRMEAAARTAHLDATQSAFALHAYRRMAFIRAFEKTCWDLSARTPPAIAGSLHFCAGQEAIPVGAAAALGEADAIVATYRGHGWALESGVTPSELMGEICHRATGINGGRAGSAYIMAPGRGFIGENSIVGAGAPIACGAALAARHKGSGGVVLVSFGDGATSQGALHEALVFAAARDLPVVFLCEANGWSEMTPTREIVKLDRIAKRAGGYGIRSATIDGGDPLAVRESVALAAEAARAGQGPSFLECRTIRLWGHYNKDIEHYRPKDDRIAAEAADPLDLLRGKLVSVGLATADRLERIAADAEREVAALADEALAASPPATESARHHVLSAQPPRRAPTRPAEPQSAATDMTYVEAVNAALRRELAERDDVIVYGEDVGQAGGIFGASRRLQGEFGPDRVFDTPIAESAILGAAVGAALSGLRPVAEIMWADFSLVALDQLFNQATNVRYITSGTSCVPMVVRMQQGATPGSCAQHSQSLEALFAHIPGLKIGLPATPNDAYHMLRAAVADPDPCIVIEARALYQRKGPVFLEAPREGVRDARLRREGKDVALVSWGTMVGPACDAADLLTERGIEAAVLDLRWLSPLDDAALDEVVRTCGGNVVVAHEANRTGGFGAEIAARLLERNDSRALRFARVAAPDIRMPAAPVLQQALLPDAAGIAAAAAALLGAGRTGS